MQSHNTNRFRPEESRTAKVLKAFLAANGYSASFRRNRKDPPDIIFKVDGERWAVEHTTLHQYVQGGKDGLSREAVTAQAGRIRKILSERTAGRLTSTWIVYLPGRLPNKKIEKEVVNCIAKAIISGNPDIINELYPGEKFGLILSPSEKISVKRAESESASPEIAMISGISSCGLVPKYNKPVADVRAQIDYALDEIERKKCPRMESVQGYNKKVLLIENRYLAGEPEIPEIATQSIAARETLVLVFDIIYFENKNVVTEVWKSIKG